MKNLILITLIALFSLEGFAQDIDPNYYYRLTTSWQGEGKSLDIINDDANNKPILAETGNYSSQMWKITPLKDGYYRLTTASQGEDKSLDIINDGANNKPILAETGDYSGQMWKITPLGRGFNRLTTAWQGEGKSLDIINDGANNKLVLAETGNYSGQMWKITKVKPINNVATKPIRKPTTTTGATVSTKTKTVEKPELKRRNNNESVSTRNTSIPTRRANNESVSTRNTGTPPTPTTDEERIEVEIFNLVNAHRVKMGLHPYQYDPIVRRYSHEHSVYMKGQGTISHDTFKSRMGQLSNEVGGAMARGENVALNSSAKGAFNLWLNSPGHRKNIEKATFTHAALGVVSKGGGMYYLTHIFIQK